METSIRARISAAMRGSSSSRLIASATVWAVGAASPAAILSKTASSSAGGTAGLKGNEVIKGLRGKDLICAGPDNDVIRDTRGKNKINCGLRCTLESPELQSGDTAWAMSQENVEIVRAIYAAWLEGESAR